MTEFEIRDKILGERQYLAHLKWQRNKYYGKWLIALLVLVLAS